jgi:sulfoacetaldehyde acetyltransferase
MKQKMTPSEALVETRVAEGVKEVFGIVGSAFMDCLDLFPAAASASSRGPRAGGGPRRGRSARVTGRPQCCIAQNGPGASTSSRPSPRPSGPIPGGGLTRRPATRGIGTGGFQEIDLMPFFQNCTQVPGAGERPDRMAELARRCFSIAKSENGPTQIEHSPRLFLRPVRGRDLRHARGPARPRAPGQIQQAAKMLAKAGTRSSWPGAGCPRGLAHDEARALAEFLTAPVVNSYLHNDSFPADHPLAAGPIGYCGPRPPCAPSPRPTWSWPWAPPGPLRDPVPQYDMEYFPRKAKIIQVDVDHRVLSLSRRVDLGRVRRLRGLRRRGPAGPQGSGARPQAGPGPPGRRGRREGRLGEELDKWSSSTAKLMHPRRFLPRAVAAIPKGSIVCTDIGNN